MKKNNFLFVLLCVASMFCSCKWGSYVPSTLNVGGTSTQVILSQANFRVVRNIEAVIEVNNDNLRRADVEKSAFAELTRKYPLTGSQAYINVVCEEIRRENSNIFRYWFGGQPNLKQFIAVRATIIEFLQENGEPIQSVASPYNTAPQRTIQKENPTADERTQITKDPKSQRVADEAYIMILLKKGQFDYKKKAEANQMFNIDALEKQKTKYSVNELQTLSEGYDKKLEKFNKK